MRFWLLVPLVFTLTFEHANAASANYADFSDTTGLTINGDAAQSGNVLRLVPNVDTQAGSAYLTTPVPLSSATSFSTSFEFNIATNPGDPTDGFTFLLQNTGVNALGAGGQGLGYVGLAPSVAVVFRGRGPSFIGVITGGLDPADPSINFAPPGSVSLTQGQFYNQNEFAWIDYNAGTNDLSVFLSTDSTKPGIAIMSTSVNISDVLGAQAYVGFSAGNGGAFGTQDILNWSFTSAVPEPESYAMLLAGLGLLGFMARRRKQQAA